MGSLGLSALSWKEGKGKKEGEEEEKEAKDRGARERILVAFIKSDGPSVLCVQHWGPQEEQPKEQILMPKLTG